MILLKDNALIVAAGSLGTAQRKLILTHAFVTRMMMDLKYQMWIEKNYPNRMASYGACKEATLKMVTDFPELKRKSGQVFVLGYEHEVLHWWCEDAEGNVIDPTANQYTDAGYVVMGYEEYPEDHPARSFDRKKCMECGEYYYQTPEFVKFSPCCSQECIRAFEKGFL